MTFENVFVAFALTVNGLLVLNFAARRWRPQLERRWGWLVYAMGLPAVLLALTAWAGARPWYYGLACLLYAAWSAFGYSVDIVWPVSWRNPPRWPVFLPYASLYVASLIALWVPLWFIGFGGVVA